MPSPIGHSIISLAVYYLFKNRMGSLIRGWKALLFVLIAGSLPDLDYIPGILIGDPKRFHLTYTHTLGFVIAVSFSIWLFLFLYNRKNANRIAGITFVLILIHIIADSFNIDSRPPIGVMLFWPFTDKYFYSSISWFQPVWCTTIKDLFTKSNIYAVAVELVTGIALLLIAFIINKTKRFKFIIVCVMFFLFTLFFVKSLNVDRGNISNSVVPIKKELKGTIVFVSNRNGNNQIYTIKANGEGLKQLTYGDSENITPSWSYDGRKIAFVSTRDGNKEIYIMDKNGKRQTRLTFDSSSDIDPVWMPDGKHVLFLSDRKGTLNFHTVNIDTKEVKAITQFDRGTQGGPSVSSGGDTIVYISDESLGWQIHSYNVLTNHKERLTGPPGGSCDPDISSDSKKVLYVSRFGMGNSDVWIMDSDGNNKRQLIAHPALDYNPNFSPDDKYIVFNSERDGNWDLYIFEIDSKEIFQLTNDSNNNNDSPDWVYTD